jgi:integrase
VSTENEKQVTKGGPLGSIYKRPGRPYWYIAFSHAGRRYRECSESTREATARALLRKRQSEVQRRGKVTGPRIEATTFADVERLLLEHYARNRRQGFGANEADAEARRARKSVEGRLAHLRRHFGRMRAADIRYKAVEEYAEQRRRQGASPSTVKTELAHLRLGLVRCVAADLLDAVPLFPRLSASPPREGSATPEQIAKLVGHLPEHVRSLVLVAYAVGWRIGHLRRLTWSENVLPGPVLHLPRVADNKKRAANASFDCSVVPWLTAVIEQQRRRAAEIGMALGKGRPVAWVFPNTDGEMVSENAFKLAWRRARKLADLAHLRPHDLRRSATQNARQAGIDKRARMDIIGHRTEAVHDAYDAAAQRELADAAQRIGAMLAPVFEPMLTGTQPGTEPKDAESVGG